MQYPFVWLFKLPFGITYNVKNYSNFLEVSSYFLVSCLILCVVLLLIFFYFSMFYRFLKYNNILIIQFDRNQLN